MKMVMVSSKEYNELVTCCSILESELSEKRVEVLRLTKQKKELENEVVEQVEKLEDEKSVLENQRDAWINEAKKQKELFDKANKILNESLLDKQKLVTQNKELAKKLEQAEDTIKCIRVAEEIGRQLHASEKKEPKEIQKAWELLHKMYNIDQCIDYNEELGVDEFNVYFNSKNFLRKMEGVADELMAAGIYNFDLLGDSKEGVVIVREKK